MKNLRNKIINCISVLTLFLMLLLKINAQQLEIGIRYNPELSGLINKNDNNAGSGLSPTNHVAIYSGGIGAIYNIDNIGLAIDILFSREGQTFNGNFNDNPIDPATYSAVVKRQLDQNNMTINGNYVAKAELNFVKIPLMLSISSDNTKPIFYSLLIGPQFNILEGVAQEVNHSDLDYPNSNLKPYNLYSAITFDGIIAVGASYNLSPKWVLSARLRFDYSFEDVENKNLIKQTSFCMASPPEVSNIWLLPSQPRSFPHKEIGQCINP